MIERMRMCALFVGALAVSAAMWFLVGEFVRHRCKLGWHKWERENGFRFCVRCPKVK